MKTKIFSYLNELLADAVENSRKEKNAKWAVAIKIKIKLPMAVANKICGVCTKKNNNYNRCGFIEFQFFSN